MNTLGGNENINSVSKLDTLKENIPREIKVLKMSVNKAAVSMSGKQIRSTVVNVLDMLSRKVRTHDKENVLAGDITEIGRYQELFLDGKPKNANQFEEMMLKIGDDLKDIDDEDVVSFFQDLKKGVRAYGKDIKSKTNLENKVKTLDLKLNNLDEGTSSYQDSKEIITFLNEYLAKTSEEDLAMEVCLMNLYALENLIDRESIRQRVASQRKRFADQLTGNGFEDQHYPDIVSEDTDLRYLDNTSSDLIRVYKTVDLRDVRNSNDEGNDKKLNKCEEILKQIEDPNSKFASYHDQLGSFVDDVKTRLELYREFKNIVQFLDKFGGEKFYNQVNNFVAEIEKFQNDMKNMREISLTDMNDEKIAQIRRMRKVFKEDYKVRLDSFNREEKWPFLEDLYDEGIYEIFMLLSVPSGSKPLRDKIDETQKAYKETKEWYTKSNDAIIEYDIKNFLQYVTKAKVDTEIKKTMDVYHTSKEALDAIKKLEDLSTNLETHRSNQIESADKATDGKKKELTNLINQVVDFNKGELIKKIDVIAKKAAENIIDSIEKQPIPRLNTRMIEMNPVAEDGRVEHIGAAAQRARTAINEFDEGFRIKVGEYNELCDHMVKETKAELDKNIDKALRDKKDEKTMSLDAAKTFIDEMTEDKWNSIKEAFPWAHERKVVDGQAQKYYVDIDNLKWLYYNTTELHQKFPLSKEGQRALYEHFKIKTSEDEAGRKQLNIPGVKIYDYTGTGDGNEYSYIHLPQKETEKNNLNNLKSELTFDVQLLPKDTTGVVGKFFRDNITNPAFNRKKSSAEANRLKVNVDYSKLAETIVKDITSHQTRTIDKAMADQTYNHIIGMQNSFESKQDNGSLKKLSHEAVLAIYLSYRRELDEWGQIPADIFNWISSAIVSDDYKNKVDELDRKEFRKGLKGKDAEPTLLEYIEPKLAEKHSVKFSETMKRVYWQAVMMEPILKKIILKLNNIPEDDDARFAELTLDQKIEQLVNNENFAILISEINKNLEPFAKKFAATDVTAQLE